MQMSAYVEQNFMYTGKAYDLGRGGRTDVVENRKFQRPGPGNYENLKDAFPTKKDDNAVKGFK